MPALLAGILVFFLLWWALKSFAKADPKQLAKLVRRLGGGLLLALAVFLGARGELFVAIPLGAFALSLLGWVPWSLPGFSQRTQRSTGQASRVRSNFFEMELDHDSGAMHGRVLAGRYEGQSLDAIDATSLMAMLAEVDAESRALLMAYLDRRAPGWRGDAQGDEASGQGAATSSGKMTQEEAYQILGVKPGATADEIGRAHRALMKKLHPDQGGSTYLAARVNEAKDVLLRRHR